MKTENIIIGLVLVLGLYTNLNNVSNNESFLIIPAHLGFVSNISEIENGTIGVVLNSLQEKHLKELMSTVPSLNATYFSDLDSLISNRDKIDCLIVDRRTYDKYFKADANYNNYTLLKKFEE